MEWLNEVTPYENMGDCDFLGCTNFEWPTCKKLDFCPVDVCLVDGNICVIKLFSIY